MKKKILFLVNHEVVIYNFRKELVERLLKENYEVYISSPDGSKIDELISLGCIHVKTNISRHSKNPFKDLLLFIKYLKLISSINPDTVLTYTIKPNIYGALASRIVGAPCFSNVTGLGTAVEKKGILQIITKYLYKISFSRIDKVYFQNQENLNFFKQHKIIDNNFKLLPGSGVNINHFDYIQYPDENNGLEFIFISRIMKEKGIEEYIKAAKEIKNSHPEIKFHVCGFCEENYKERLNHLDSQGIIKYHGMVNDIRKILKNVHCTVHPSYYPEGLSNVLLESAASGRPLITTDRSGCREVVDHGENGYLIEPRNTSQLIEKIRDFINLNTNQRIEMGLKSREKVEIEFNRDIVVDEYIKQIKKIDQMKIRG